MHITFAALLSVKDEVELIEHAIDHLRSIGIDLIVACDMSSTDGTAEILQQHRGNDFWVTRLDDRDPEELRSWQTKNLELVQKTGMDRAIFLDADEFWLPATGKIQDCAEIGADVLRVDRFNVPVGSRGPMMPATLSPSNYEDVLLIVEPISEFRNHLRVNPQVPWIMGVPVPKVMVRPERVGSLAVAAHDAVAPPDVTLVRAEPSDLVIAHLPFTTRARFARKLDNIRKIIRANGDFFGGNLAWHWKRWIELADAGELDQELQRTVFIDEVIRDLRQAHVIRSAADLLLPAWSASHGNVTT
jgi:glycosyltransferase involved in cell wall biosynthesis